MHKFSFSLFSRSLVCIPFLFVVCLFEIFFIFWWVHLMLFKQFSQFVQQQQQKQQIDTNLNFQPNVSLCILIAWHVSATWRIYPSQKFVAHRERVDLCAHRLICLCDNFIIYRMLLSCGAFQKFPKTMTF